MSGVDYIDVHELEHFLALMMTPYLTPHLNVTPDIVVILMSVMLLDLLCK